MSALCDFDISGRKELRDCASSRGIIVILRANNARPNEGLCPHYAKSHLQVSVKLRVRL